MQKRTTYDTALKHLYRKGLEATLPPSLRHEIPRSNICRWRSESDHKYFGAEINQIATGQLAMLQEFAEARRVQSVFRTYLRLVILLKTILSSLPSSRKTIQNAKASIVQTAEMIRPVIGLRPLLKIFGISCATFYNWKTLVEKPCPASPFRLCRQRWPQQASRTEILKMLSLLKDPRFLNWPEASVVWYALREKIVSLSVATWYRYARISGMSRRVVRKKIKSESVRASSPDQIWHADVTLFRTLDGIRHYIYLVVEDPEAYEGSYSRKILSWRVSDRLSANLRILTLREVWAGQNREFSGEKAVSLIVDGGSENHAQIIEDFISEEGVSIHILVALRDVLFSNSMVEAVNKLLKPGLSDSRMGTGICFLFQRKMTRSFKNGWVLQSLITMIFGHIRSTCAQDMPFFERTNTFGSLWWN